MPTGIIPLLFDKYAAHMILFSALMLSLFITIALIPLLKGFSFRAQLVDFPNARKVHDRPIPKIGGMAMAAGALLPMLLWLPKDAFTQSLLAGSGIIVVFGICDDLKTLGPRTKFLGQTIAAMVVIVFGGLKIDNFGNLLPESFTVPMFVSGPLTLIVIVGVTNAINLSDGLDGLAGGIMLLSAICLGYVAYLCRDIPVTLVAATLMGCIFGFLRFNTHPATIFMGDTGSQLLGFILIVLSLKITQSHTPVSPIFPLLLLGFPILDTLMVMTERISNGRSPFEADKNHFHHKLMRLGFYHSEAVVIIYCIQMFLVASAFAFMYYTEWFLLLYYAFFSSCVLVFFVYTQKSGWTFQRYPVIDTVIKGRLRILKEKQVLIKFSYGIVRFGLPALFLVVCFVPLQIPPLLAYLSLFMAVLLFLATVLNKTVAERVLRISTYLLLPYLIYLPHTESAAWLGLQGMRLYNASFGALVFFVIMVLKFTRRKKGFKPTTMDFLILLIAIVVPNLSSGGISNAFMGLLAVKIIGLLFSYEVLVGEMRGDLGTLAYPTICGFLVLFIRGF